MSLTKEIVQQKARSIYQYATGARYPDWGMNLHEWDWVPGVGVISFLDYYQAVQGDDVLDYLLQWVEQNRTKAERAKVINSMAPFAIYPYLYEVTRKEQFLLEALRTGYWMVREAPRTREGALEHTVTENANFPEQVWADTIFMAVLFLSRLAKVAGDKVLAAEAVNQLNIHLCLLQDEETGVLFHGWNCEVQHHMSSARWTRANAWVAASVPEILANVSSLIAIPAEIPSRYKRMVESLIGYQAINGMWHTVMDRNDFYQETSGSAGIACGIYRGVRSGLLSPECLPASRKAVEGVLFQVSDNGLVNGVSGGTPIMESIEAYNRIPIIPSQYGQGLSLMLLSEVLRRETL